MSLERIQLAIKSFLINVTRTNATEI